MGVVAPWRQLLQQSLKRNEKLRHSRYFQIATVKQDGRPANRTVVYRGFLWDTDHLTFVTDKRSNKVADLSSCPWAEIAWYFPETREQYRLLGKVTVLDEHCEDDKLQKARISAWKNMSDPGRQQFLWPHPGLPREGEEEAAFHTPAPSKDDDVAPPFCLCVLQVEEVDHLSLKANERRSWRKLPVAEHKENCDWKEYFVNP